VCGRFFGRNLQIPAEEHQKHGTGPRPRAGVVHENVDKKKRGVVCQKQIIPVHDGLSHDD